MKNKKGYTLVELIITLAIIGIMIVPIYDAFLNSNRTNLRSKRQISAAYLAQNEMETIKGKSLNTFITDYGNTYNQDSFDQTYSTQVANGGTTFDVSVRLENISIAVSPSTSVTHLGNTRNGHVYIKVPSTNTDGIVKLNGNDANVYKPPVNPKTINVTISDSSGEIRMTVPSHGNYWAITESSKILVDVSGYDGLTDDWVINLTNNSGLPVDVKRFVDDDNHIRVVPSPSSANDIYIGNAFPSTTATPSTLEEWFRVTITVSHKGTVYERIQSTVGK